MRIKDILRRKGSDVVTTTGDRTVLEAVQVLVEHNIGAVVVMDGERMTGILTERDILRVTATSPEDLGKRLISDAMTRDVITAGQDEGLQRVMETMTVRKIRHLPVLDGDRLVGIVSIGDVVNECRIVTEQENTHLRDYIRGRPADADRFLR